MRVLFFVLFLSFFGSPLMGIEGNCKMFQVAPFSSLEEGGFEGYYSIEDLSKEGDFGLGTFSALNGEMIAYKGKYYSINQKGQAKVAKKRALVPFAQVVEFNPESSYEVKNLRNLKIVTETLAEEIEMRNLPHAIVIEGRFAYLKLSSQKAQRKPYPNLESAREERTIYHYEETEGVAIGFWVPSYWEPLMEKGYHFGFLNDSGTRGGHVLDMHLVSGKVSIMPIQNIELYLPKDPSFDELDLERASD